MKSVYVDSCIYLNLWQKEGNEKFGIPYWKIAETFLEDCSRKNRTIYYSCFVLKELEFVLAQKEFTEKRKVFDCLPFKKINISAEEIGRARKMESELMYEISFYDIMHILSALKTNSILVTRDKKLLHSAKKYSVTAKKPEELLIAY